MLFQKDHPLINSYQSDYCNIYTTSTLLPNGYFFVPQYPAVATVSGTFNAVIVGYSDETVPSSTIHQFSSHHLPVGGFILRGNKGVLQGTRISTLDGTEDSYNCSTRCSSPKDPQEWNGCYRKNNKIYCDSNVSPLICRPSAVTKKICEENQYYAILRTETEVQEHVVSERPDGLTTTRIIKVKIENDQLVPIGDAFDFTEIPYWDLGNIFMNKFLEDTEEEYKKQKELCGYWFLPYELFELASSMAGPQTGSAMVMDLPTKWSMQSLDALKDNTKSFKADGVRFLND